MATPTLSAVPESANFNEQCTRCTQQQREGGEGGTRVCLRSAAKNDSKDVIQDISEVKVHLNIQKQWWLFASTVIMQITAVGGTEQNVFSKCFK